MRWTREDSLSDEVRRALFEWDPDPFQSKIWNLTWRPQQQHLVSWEGEQPASHIGLVRETVYVGKEPITVGGLGGVITLPAFRGRGLAQSGLRKAEQFFAEEWKLQHALLFCFPLMRAFYVSLGWSVREQPVQVQQPQGVIHMQTITMVKALGGAIWPEGTIEIHGCPW